MSDEQEKLASTVAQAIVRDIVDRAMPTGAVVGGERELVERYGVSRAVLREAIRLVEHQRLARMRRGPGGGLVVETPTVASAGVATALYLMYRGATRNDVAEAAAVLDGLAAELAASATSTSSIARLRERVDEERSLTQASAADHWSLHRIVSETCGNPLLEFLVELLRGIAGAGESTKRAAAGAPSTWAPAHRSIVNAIVAGDARRARGAMTKHAKTFTELPGAAATSRASKLRSNSVRAQALPVRMAPGDSAISRKRAEGLAEELYRSIVRRGWPLGESLGSEAELMATHSVSRGVLREAIRVLEYHNVAAMRRGPAGGLTIDRPTLRAADNAMAASLRDRGVQAAHHHVVLGELTRAALAPVAGRLSGEALTGLRYLVAAARFDVDDARRRAADAEFFPAVAALGPNPVYPTLARLVAGPSTPLAHAGAAAGARFSDEQHALRSVLVDDLASGVKRRVVRSLDAALAPYAVMAGRAG
ncbi:MAG: FadR/GntR family transcriptional regulator [Acidimicrobiia bacterium]